MHPVVDSAPQKSPAVAPPSAVIPGMAWIPAITVEWSGSAIKAAGGWLGTAVALRMAARRALVTEPAGARLDPIDYILVCSPNENSAFLTDGGDERPINLGDVRAICAELDRLLLGAGPHAASAERVLVRIAEHLAGHGLRIGEH